MSRRGKTALLTLACAAALFVLYFFRLDAMGMVAPDEPRYAAIGREMALSGDWVTPRLWGKAWFEKPALLYWMTATATLLGAGLDLAPRLPVALLSTAFLLFFFWILRREWGTSPALYASAILASSAGWIAFSQIGVTDLPLAAAFSAATLLTLPWLARRDRSMLPASAALLGLAVLAKGLVPLVLVLPLFWFGRKQLGDLLRPSILGAFAVVALPWYVLCALRNGSPFLETFFLQHQLGRFTSGALQHGQPLWFYLPVLLGCFFPWTIMLGLLFRRPLYRTANAKFLLAIAAFGFAFFSLSANKLPGYLLPLLPALAALMGLALHQMRVTAPWLLLSTVTLAWAPVIGSMLPVALESGLRHAWPVPEIVRFQAGLLMLPLVMAGGTELLAERFKRRTWAVAIVFGLTVVAVAWLKVVILPKVDQAASARPFYQPGIVCAGPMPRARHYGLNYYAGRDLPDCKP
ncbi:MAG: glycosyltransferase family 39 protein [Acidobacteriota bacterium]|nr:glycosyltransferase family 39 protein [Acidobacteriota bacterium]